MDLPLTLAAIFAVFIPALLLPGPDFVAVVRSSMTRGTAGGLMTTLGVSLGLGLYAALSLLGLSAILVEFQWLTWLVRVLGGSYLIYLGLRLLIAPVEQIDVQQGRGGVAGNPLLFGFLVTLTNPKAVVLFTSVFATAVTKSTPHWFLSLIIGLVMLSAIAWYSVVSMFMSSERVMRRFKNAQHWVERAAGVCFISIGGRILADARNPVSP